MSGFGAVTHLRKAERALKSARALLQEGDTEGACNRAYYAMFHAAHVALETAGTIKAGGIYKTHSGLIAAFSKELVLTKKVADQLGRALAQAHDIRLLADYSGDAPDVGIAIRAVDQAESFVIAIGEMG